MDVPSLHARLKVYTDRDHQALHRAPILAALVRPGLDRGTYAEALRRFLSFYAGMSVEGDGPHAGALASARNIRVQALRTDLGALGAPPPEPGGPGLVVGGEGRALGVRYVVEGSTQGANVLGRAIRRALGADVPLAYFDLSDVGWDSVRGALAAVPDDHVADVLEGAGDGFAALRRRFEPA